MTVRAAPTRPSVASRRFGYVVAVAVNGALLYALTVWPGWHAVPFLTAETAGLVPLMVFSLLVSVAANLVYVAYDPRWFRAAGDVITTTVGLYVVVQVWLVYPFRFPDGGIAWDVVAQVLLMIAIVGSLIAVLVALVSLVRSLVGTRRTVGSASR